ncbi:MAG: hypothetical protein EOP19_06065 [Hyphomicrobiales bacterium]|nr:MAG: hypothetical protein EOP19_06065 [Hyphomicrobiales bacterium]
MQDPTNSGASSGVSALSPDRSAETAASAPASVDQAKAAAGDVAQTASSLAGQAKQKLTGTLDSQKGAAADFVEELAQTVQRSGEQFEGRQDWIASAVGRGAAELNTLAGSLRDKDLGELAGQVQSFARRQPALFMGAALAAGFAVARLGKVVAGDLSRDDLPTVPEVNNGQH